MKQYIFGIDLGGTTVKLGLFTLEGKLLDKWEIPTRTADAGAEILPDIAAALKAKQEERGISVSQVAGFVKPCVNLQGWGGDAAGALSALCGCPVKVVNDANAAALGEMWLGGGKGYSNVVFVTLGTGVGGGIIVDSKLLTGVHGSGGEIGHIKVNPAETVACGCGKKGCLEQYTSATGVVREARRRLAASDAPSLMRQSDPLTSKDVFDCAKAGDALALEVVDFFADYLGRGLACVSCVCDPQVFVLGGGVSAAGQIIIDRAAEAFRCYAFPAAEETRLVLARLGNDAGICGAARLVLDR